MTMPHLGNCPHKPGTWCLACVKEEWERREAELSARDAQIAELERNLAACKAKLDRYTTIEAVGFVAGTDGRVVVEECRVCGGQRRVPYAATDAAGGVS